MINKCMHKLGTCTDAALEILPPFNCFLLHGPALQIIEYHCSEILRKDGHTAIYYTCTCIIKFCNNKLYLCIILAELKEEPKLCRKVSSLPELNQQLTEYVHVRVVIIIITRSELNLLAHSFYTCIKHQINLNDQHVYNYSLFRLNFHVHASLHIYILTEIC